MVVVGVVVLVEVLVIGVVVFGGLGVESLVFFWPVLPPRLMAAWSTPGRSSRPMAAWSSLVPPMGPRGGELTGGGFLRVMGFFVLVLVPLGFVEFFAHLDGVNAGWSGAPRSSLVSSGGDLRWGIGWRAPSPN